MAILYVILVLVILMLGCAPNNQIDNPSSSENEPTSSPYLPVSTSITLSSLPKVEEETIITVTTVSSKDVSVPVTNTITLPEGISYVAGDLSWTGTLEKNVPRQFSTKVRVEEEGVWLITTQGYGFDQIYLSVLGDKVSTSKNLPLNQRGRVQASIPQEKITPSKGVDDQIESKSR